MNYNKKLCKKAFGENFWRESRSVRVFVSKTVTEIFLGALVRNGNRRTKRPFHRE
jgi:hypothetical protein